MLATRIDYNDPLYALCEYCVKEYENTLNEAYLDYFLEADDGPQLKPGANDDEIAAYVRDRTAWEAQQLSSNPFTVMKKIDEMDKEGGGNKMPSRTGHNQLELVKAGAFWRHKNTIRAKRLAFAASLTAGLYKYRNQPRTVISRKIAALRKALMKYQKRMQGNILSRERSILETVCVKITKAINTLLKFLQEKTDKYFQ